MAAQADYNHLVKVGLEGFAMENQMKRQPQPVFPKKANALMRHPIVNRKPIITETKSDSIPICGEIKLSIINANPSLVGWVSSDMSTKDSVEFIRANPPILIDKTIPIFGE